MKIVFWTLLVCSYICYGQTSEVFTFDAFIQGRLNAEEFHHKCKEAETFYQARIDRLEAQLSGTGASYVVHSRVNGVYCQIMAGGGSKTMLVWRFTEEERSTDLLKICMGQMEQLRQEPDSVFARVAYYISDVGDSCQVKQVRMIMRKD
jgi:hypothetical protein